MDFKTKKIKQLQRMVMKRDIELKTWDSVGEIKRLQTHPYWRVLSELDEERVEIKKRIKFLEEENKKDSLSLISTPVLLSQLKLNFEEIKSDIESGQTITSVANKWSVPRKTLYYHFKSKASSYDKCSRRIYSFNERYFKECDNQNVAYLIGYIFADGCVRENGTLVVYCNDVYFCDALKEELKATNVVAKNKTRNGWTIRVNSQHLIGDLEKFEIVPRKTYVSKRMPRVPKCFESHMLRGFFDGDGTAFFNKSKGVMDVGFTGMYEVMKDLQKMLSGYGFFVNRNVVKDKNSNACKLYGLNKGQLKDFVEMIYRDAELALPRKKNLLCL